MKGERNGRRKIENERKGETEVEERNKYMRSNSSGEEREREWVKGVTLVVS